MYGICVNFLDIALRACFYTKQLYFLLSKKEVMHQYDLVHSFFYFSRLTLYNKIKVIQRHNILNATCFF